MSVSASQIYDGNLFATPASSEPKSDLISRFGPTLEAGFLSLPFEIAARYELQAERYLDHPALDREAAHQDASVTIRLAPSSRLRLTTSGSYVRTQTPGELNLQTQLGLGRRPARRAMMSADASYRWTEVTALTASHAFARDALVGGSVSVAHDSRLVLQRRSGPRSTVQADYQFRTVAFDGGSPVISQAITAGGSYWLTAKTGIEVALGPRFTQQTIRPEVSAILRHQRARGEMSIAYARTEVTAIGASAPIDVQRLAAGATYRIGRRTTVGITPAFAHHTLGGQQVPVYSLEIDSAVAVTRQLSVVASARQTRQDGNLAGPRDVIPSRNVMLRVMMTLPRTAARD